MAAVENKITANTSPARVAFDITRSDSAELPYVTRGIYIGTGGNLHVRMVDGGDVTFKNVQSGTVLPIRVVQVYGSGTTTASDIIGLY